MVRSGSLDVWVSVRLPGQLAETVRGMARARRTTVSAIIRSALEEQEKTHHLAARLEQVLEALGHIPAGHLAAPAAGDQTDPGGPSESGAEEAGMADRDNPQPMDEEALRKRMQAMLAAFGGDGDEE